MHVLSDATTYKQDVDLCTYGSFIMARKKPVLERKIDGSRSRRRQRKKYLDDDLVAAVGCLRKGELFHLTEDRERFRCMVTNVN